MTQTLNRPTLAIRLTPMDVPVTRPWAEDDAVGLAINAPAIVNPLLLHPGEPTEAEIAIENCSHRTLDLSVAADGDFPAAWCQILRSRQLLAPGEKLASILLFQVPETFFEESEQSPNSSPLQLERQGQLRFFVLDPSGAQYLLRSIDFTLYLRPRSLYLDFLPTLYREVDLVGRFLKVFEMAFEPDVQTLEGLWAYLNPRLAPEGMLPFLAHWVGWQLSADLTLEHQRDLIARAMEIYRWRGTRRGLRLSLHLATGLPLDAPEGVMTSPITITESFGPGLVLGETEVGNGAIVGGTKPFHFHVLLRQPPGFDLDESLIRQTIEHEKPAFCSYDLTILPAEDPDRWRLTVPTRYPPPLVP
ncbi:MAG: phage tail protein [Cyanobacteria bacterium J06639_14]